MDDHIKIAEDDMTALVGSRLCHDLINPLGAIGNGVELLTMVPGTLKPEVALIAEAVRDAQARIRFFRIAFGVASREGRIAKREITEILEGLYGNGGRLSVIWEPTTDLPRMDVKIGLLMLACVEHALPLGGEVRMSETDGTFTVNGSGKRLHHDADLWGVLDGDAPGRDLAPSEVQFLLFSQEAHRQDRVIRYEIGETTITLTA